jgi:CHAD domain-containing protein
MAITFTHPDLPRTAIVDALEHAGFDVASARPITRVVFDTFDGRLAEAGLRLEHRRDPEVALVLRGEPGEPTARLAGATAPRWPAGLPGGPLRSRLTAVTKERALVPLLAVTSQASRAERRDRRGKATVVAELHDDVEVEGHVLPGWLLELHEVAGHGDERERIATRLLSLGLPAQDGDVATFAARATGRSIEGRSSSPVVPLDASEPALAGYRRVLANLADTIEANRPGTIDDIDEEFLHELRVAVRRTRSVLAQGKGVLPDDVRDHYRDAFGELGQQTGPARDLDVYVAGWDAYIAPLGLDGGSGLDKVKSEIEDRRRLAHAELSAVLRNDACGDLIDGWRAWLADPSLEVRPKPHLGPVVARRIEKAQDKVLTDGRAITASSPGERLHDLRKDTKKLRYLLECFGTLLPADERKAFVSQLKALQDNLGEHQDAEVHLAQLRDLAHDLHERAVVDTDALLAMGRLSDVLERRRSDERSSFAERFANYDRKANRKALETMLARVRKG